MKEVNAAADRTLKMTEKQDFPKSSVYCQKTMNLVHQFSHNVDVYNVLKTEKLEEDTKLSKIMNNRVKTALNLTTTWTDFNPSVYYSLNNDFMKPVTDLGNTSENISIKYQKFILSF